MKTNQKYFGMSFINETQTISIKTATTYISFSVNFSHH
jgi:hypothetical protein